MNASKAAIVFGLAALLVVAASPAAAAERPYDAAVSKWITGANRGLDKFARELSDKAKGAKVTRDGVETDISDFLADFKTEGKRLEERWNEGKSGEANALGFLRKAKATDGFIARHPGFTGAETEWAAMKPTVMSLASAYGIDWNGDPATWAASRTRDAEVASLLKGMDAQAKGVGKALTAAGKAAKVDKGALSGLKAQAKSLAGSSAALSKAFSKKQPIGAAASAFQSSLDQTLGAASALGLSADTVPALGSLTSSAQGAAKALNL